MQTYDAQPWDCSSHHHAVYVMDRATPCPWMAKIDGEMYPAKVLVYRRLHGQRDS